MHALASADNRSRVYSTHHRSGSTERYTAPDGTHTEHGGGIWRVSLPAALVLAI